jgi:hypothetical protein
VQLGSIADDPGLGWHLKTGEYIYNHNSIPRHDPFLAAAVPGGTLHAQGIQRPWVSDQWLGDLLLYGLFAKGGWPLVYASVVFIYVAAFFGVAGDGVRAAGRSGAASALGGLVSTLLAWKIGQVHLIVRPVIFSIFLFAVVFTLVRRLCVDERLSRVRLAKCAVLLGALFVVWANLHPAFVLGLLLVASLVGLSLVLQRNRTAAFMLIGLVCGGSTLLNPAGYHLHASIADLGQSAYFLSLNQEWLPLDLWSFEGKALLVLVCFAAVGALMRRNSGGLRGWFDPLIGGVFFLLSVKSVRFLPFASIALLPLATEGVSALRHLPLPSVARLTVRSVSFAERYEERFRRAGLLSSLLCGVLFLLVALAYGERAFLHPLGPSVSTYPAGVMRALVNADAQSGVVFASPNWGGAITLNLFPRFRAVIDDRNAMLGEGFYRAADAAMRDRKAFEQLVGDFKVSHVILPLSAPIAQQLLVDSQWSTLYRDASVVVLASISYKAV